MWSTRYYINAYNAKLLLYDDKRCKFIFMPIKLIKHGNSQLLGIDRWLKYDQLSWQSASTHFRLHLDIKYSRTKKLYRLHEYIIFFQCILFQQGTLNVLFPGRIKIDPGVNEEYFVSIVKRQL